MSAQPQETRFPLPAHPSADEGPVPETVAGFDDRALERVEADEELFALEDGRDMEGDIDDRELPDELGGPDATGPTGGADAGAVPELRPGFDATTLGAAEGDEELSALESDVAGSTLPGETPPLANHPTKAPSRKVKASGLGGLLAALPAPLIAALDTVTVPAPTLTAIGAALTLAGAVAAAYLARERVPQV
jgi:hypothetical protein